MADLLTTRSWAYRGLYVLLSVVAISVGLLPLGDGTGGLPGPDLPVVIAFAWILRRPGYVPAALLASVMLFSDAVELRPLGLWAALIVLGGEFLRAREAATRDMPFAMEWGLIAVVLTVLTVVYWIALTIFVVPQPGLGPLLLRALISTAVYPMVVAISGALFGLRRVAPGEVDALGRRL